MTEHDGTSDYAEREHAHLEAELAELRRRRDQMRAEIQNDAETVGDRGDAADALQDAVDFFLSD